MSRLRHHAKPQTLADFAAGRLDQPRAVVVATHAALCGECALTIADFEAVGGLCLDETEPALMADDALERVLKRADASANVFTPAPGGASESALPYDAYLDGGVDDIDWKPIVPGVAQHIIGFSRNRASALKLLKIAPGMEMMKHSHGGDELTLILRGAYEDEIGAFAKGDLADLDSGHTHAPKAIGDEPCVCLIAATAPLKFKSVLGRVAQPFIGF